MLFLRCRKYLVHVFRRKGLQVYCNLWLYLHDHVRELGQLCWSRLVGKTCDLSKSQAVHTMPVICIKGTSHWNHHRSVTSLGSPKWTRRPGREIYHPPSASSRQPSTSECRRPLRVVKRVSGDDGGALITRSLDGFQRGLSCRQTCEIIDGR